MPLLTPAQTAVLGALTWLQSPEPRRQGRTTLLAIATIRAAMLHPGFPIMIRDHSSNQETDRILVGVVDTLLQSDPRLHGLYSFRSTRPPRLTFHAGPGLARVTSDPWLWLPQGWSMSGDHLALRALNAVQAVIVQNGRQTLYPRPVGRRTQEDLEAEVVLSQRIADLSARYAEERRMSALVGTPPPSPVIESIIRDLANIPLSDAEIGEYLARAEAGFSQGSDEDTPKHRAARTLWDYLESEP